MHQGITATHKLESKGKTLSVGSKHVKAQQSLTSCRDKNRHHQQVKHSHVRLQLTSWRDKNRYCQQIELVMHGSHSQTREPRIGVIKWLETHRSTAAAHQLESREQVSSTCLKHTEAWKPLTYWRTEDGHHQQALMHRGAGRTTATHSLYSQGQGSSDFKATKARRQPLTSWRTEDVSLAGSKREAH